MTWCDCVAWVELKPYSKVLSFRKSGGHELRLTVKYPLFKQISFYAMSPKCHHELHPKYKLSNMSSYTKWSLSVAHIGRLSSKSSVLFLCDMQEKFRPTIFQFSNIVSNAARLLQVICHSTWFEHACAAFHS